MAILKPKSIKRIKPYLLELIWNDFTAVISLERLRRECPCADCTGEAIGNVVYSRPKEVKNEPGAFDLVDLKPMGNYAIAVAWANGHRTGIYTWEKIREIADRFNLSEDELKELAEKNKKNEKKIQLSVIK